MMPQLQQRHHDYVLGPRQDPRLASVAAGALIKGVTLQLDSDAPFALRSRAVRTNYTAALTQATLQGLRTRWAGPTGDYRQQGMVPEGLQMANYGQCGNPKPVFPEVMYPANGLITVDVENTGATAITGLYLYFRGVKLFPWGAVPAYTYPETFGGLAFDYPQPVVALGVSEERTDNIFTVQTDADFVVRGGQCTAPFVSGEESTRTFAEIFIRLKDFNKKPYSNDWVHLDVIFGAAAWPSTIPVSNTPVFVAPFGVGPSQKGLFYPEIYVPENHQLLYDLLRADGSGGSNQAESFVITLSGAKVFQR